MLSGIRYINIHSHLPTTESDTFTLLNYFKITELFHGYFSIGIHPWYITSLPLPDLYIAASKTNCLAIGECGLDKLCDTPWKLQKDIFEQQIAIANQLQKPLIIHCVKAYDDALLMLRNAKVPVVFHGFRKSLRLARRILDKGYYISLGNPLIKNPSLQQVLKEVPLNQVFLETDQEDISIKSMYNKASEILNIKADTLILQQIENFKQLIAHER